MNHVRFRALACALAVAVFRSAQAHDFCVSTAQELQDALDAVSDGGAYVNEANFIDVVRGTYRTGTATSGIAFHSKSMTSTHELHIEGGLDSGCSLANGALLPASSTILDAHGISGVMQLDRPNGAIAVSLLTLRNGENTAAGGLDVNELRFTPVTAAVRLDHLILTNNHSTGSAGGLYTMGGGSDENAITLQVNSTLIAGNSSDHDDGAAYLYTQNGSIEVWNLTVADNQSPTGTTGGLYCAGNVRCEIESSIFRGNTHFGLNVVAPWNYVYCSDYGTLGGNPLDVDYENLSVAPGFVDAAHGDYHLAGDSPLLAQCEPSYTIDLDGHAFGSSGRSDMGAYAETIFFDDFQTH